MCQYLHIWDIPSLCQKYTDYSNTTQDWLSPLDYLNLENHPNTLKSGNILETLKE